MRLIQLFIILLVFSCENSTKMEHESPKPKEPVEAPTGLSYRVEFKDDLGWGYQIFDGSTLILNQDHIPAIQGNIGFPSKSAAEKTAKYIIQKLENDIFPPTLTVTELDSLGVIPVN